MNILVVDGASTDNSVDIIRKYESKLAWWVSEKDNGQADAINKGFARATGEVIAWLNSDDYYLAGTVSAAVKIFEEHPDVVLVYGNMLAVDEDGKTFNTLNYKQLTLEDLLCFQIIGQPAVFMRRSALQAAGGLDPTFHFMLDHHLWIRIAQQGKILHVDQTWAAARYHAEAKNIAKAAEFGRDAFRILDCGNAQDENSCTCSRKSKSSRTRICQSRGCALSARWRTTCISFIRMDARTVHPSANGIGAVEYICFSNFEFVWFGEITFSDLEQAQGSVIKTELKRVPPLISMGGTCKSSGG